MKTFLTETVISNSDNFSLILTMNGQVEYASESLVGIVGINNKDRLKHIWFEGNDGVSNSSGSLKAQVMKLFTDPECKNSLLFEKKTITFYNEIKWIEWRVRVENNSLLIGEGQDITRFKLREEALLVEKKKLEEKLVIKSKNLDKLSQNTRRIREIIEDIGDSLSEEIITRKIYYNLKEVVSLDALFLFQVNDKKENFECNFSYYRHEKLNEFTISFQEADKSLRDCFAKKEAIIDNDCNAFISGRITTTEDKIISNKLGGFYNHSDCTNFYVPLISNNKITFILLFQSFHVNAFNDFQIDVLKNISFSLGKILENASLFSRMEERVKERTIEVETQKTLIECKNKDITESIQYAKKIQVAMLQPETELNKLITDSFILYKPKDIVSGDFYWFYKSDNKSYVAVVDCTGHGVPGALMSVIGNSIFRDVIIKRKTESPDQILSLIDKELDLFLNKDGNTSKTADGMDVALAVLDHEKKEILFSGAFRPLLMVREKEVIEFRGNRFPIGFYQTEQKIFESQKISVQNGDRFYLFSDGYIDQFGGEKGKKLNRKRFHELLISAYDMSMEEQKSFLEYAFNNWKQEEEQTDDILVIGFSV